MVNKKHRKFRNALKSLKDCYENLQDDLDDNPKEKEARRALVQLCSSIAEEFDLNSEIDFNKEPKWRWW